MLETPAHLVFVDFENVPTFDLDSIGGLPVFVTGRAIRRRDRLTFTPKYPDPFDDSL